MSVKFRSVSLLGFRFAYISPNCRPLFKKRIEEKEMAPHSSVLACRISGMEEPGGLLSMMLHRVGPD